MRLSTKLSGIVAIGGVAALGAGLISSGGIGAAFTDSATATAKVSVGDFGCELSTTDNAVTITNPGPSDGAKASIDFGEVQSSAPASNTAVVTLTNSGTIPLVTSWNLDPTGGLFGSNASGNVNAEPAAPSVVLQPNATQDVTIGFNWTDALTNDDLGKTGKATYTVNCSEAPASARLVTLDNSGHGNAMFNADGSVTVDTSSGSALIKPKHFSATPPSTYPSFKVDKWDSGNGYPALVIYLNNGKYITGYPSAATDVSGIPTAHWTISPWSGTPTITWNDVLSSIGSATVTGVEIGVSGADSNGATITSFCYGGTAYIGEASACGW